MFVDEDISVILKRIKNSWNTKIGFAIGPRVEVASMVEHEKEFSEEHSIKREDFEFKKRTEYEKDLESLCIVMHAKEEKKEEINEIAKTIDND